MKKNNFVVLTISDSCHAGTNVDKAGPRLSQCIKQGFSNATIERKLLPDEEQLIVDSLIYYSDIFKADVIFTAGGTGFSPRDVTPEATQKVIKKLATGIMTALCVESLKITPMAMMSRSVCGMRNSTLIINFPGSAKAVEECFNIIKPVLSHCIDVLHDDSNNVKCTHRKIQAEDNVEKSKNVHKCSKHKHSAVPGIGRERISPYPMIEVNDAFYLMKEIFKTFSIPQKMEIYYADSLGYTLAENVIAEEPFPPFEASIKDGYACLYEDGTGERKVVYNVSAGDNPSQVLKSGECVTINTGAPLPPGANCVVQIEDTNVISICDGKEDIIEILTPPLIGQDIRPVGSDIEKNTVVVSKGKRIQPADIGLFATVGKMNVSIYRRPLIGLLSTGNEICDPATVNLKRGYIRDSNKATLSTLFRKHNMPIKDYGICIDDPQVLTDKIKSIFEEVDILISTGSVSMGDKDYLKHILQNKFDAKILFGRLNMKPGKPTTFATCSFEGTQKFIFGLPGNPVSALVTSQILVIPILMYHMGDENYELTKLKVMLDEDVDLDIRPHYARAVMQYAKDDKYPVAKITGNQISSRLISSAGADVLLELPGASNAQTYLKKHDLVTAILIN